MRICLIRPPAPELLNDRIDPPVGLLFIGTMLKKYGHEVDILDFAGGEAPAIPRADLYGMTLFTTSYPDAIKLRDEIRTISDAPVVVGGPHPQALPQRTAQDFDYVVCGEAEADFPHIIDQLAERRWPQQVIYAKAPQNLGALPYNDYSMVDVPSYNRVVAGQTAFSVLSGRGCPFKCTYCYTAALAEKVRLRPVDHMMGELYELEAAYGVNSLRFIDDNFLMNRQFFKELAPRLREFGRPYRVYCRAVDLTPERCELLAWSGCVMVACGIESGSQKMQDMMNTRKSVEKMTEGVIAAKRCGIEVRAGLIVGYPGETWETVKESVANLVKMPLDSYNLFNFVPLPGTEPYHFPAKYGITWISDNWKDFFILFGENEASYSFEHETLTRQTLADMRGYMIEELNKVFIPALNCVEYK
jgi:anaerobic magnesium-protoporphyrin IX monomethyl ester cyclase